MSLFETEHYEARLDKIRTAMRKENLDGLVVYSWKRGQVRYVSGYHPNYATNVAVVAIPLAAPPVMWIRSTFDLTRAHEESWMDEISGSGTMKQLAVDTATTIRDRVGDGGCIGLVAGDGMIQEMPHSFFQVLQGELPKTNLVEAEHILQEVRAIKSDAEFEALRRAAAAADAGFDAVAETLAPGRSEFEVVGALEGTVRKHGSGHHLVVVSSGAADPIRPPQDRILEAGDSLIIEAAVEKAGYWAQAAQTFIVGSVSQDQRRIYQATYQAYLAGVAVAKPGNICADIANAEKRSLEEAGYGSYVEQDFGHGTGSDFPEPPRIGLDDNTLIKPGMVLVIHPGLRVSEVGRTFIGGTVLITETGPEALHRIRALP